MATKKVSTDNPTYNYAAYWSTDHYAITDEGLTSRDGLKWGRVDGTDITDATLLGDGKSTFKSAVIKLFGGPKDGKIVVAGKQED